MGNICCTSEEDEHEKDYMFAPKPNQYNGKRNWKKERHGYGTYYYDNGDVYEGNWENDEKHGLGTYHFSTGKMYRSFFRFYFNKLQNVDLGSLPSYLFEIDNKTCWTWLSFSISIQ